MKNNRKTRLGVAVAAALGAGLLMHDVSAVNLATDNIGEVAIAPYYTTRDGWATLINLTNTQPVPIVVKVRIHEGMNSRDVLDFNVALSANDGWAALIQDDPGTGNPIVNIQDADTCVIAQSNPKPLSVLGYSGTDDRGESQEDGGPTNVDRLREGYVEFIVMGYTDFDADAEDDVDVDDVGTAIQRHQCDVVTNAFNATNILNTARQFGEPINALKFNFRFLNAANGMEAGGQASTWANFWNGTLAAGGAPVGADGNVEPNDNDTCSIHRGAERQGTADWNPTDLPAADLSCLNLITAMVPYDFLEPSLNDAYPVEGNFWDDTGNVGVVVDGTVLSGENRDVSNFDEDAIEQRGADAVSATIQRATAINEWALNTETGTTTSWVITFPTKTFYVDKGNGRQFGIWADGDRHETAYDDGAAAGLNPATGYNTPYPPFADAFLPYEADPDDGDGTACQDVGLTAFNREQESTVQEGGVIDSPAPAAPVAELCNEVNVVNFSLSGQPTQGVFGSELVAMAPPLSALNPNLNGWMELNLATDPAAQAGQANPNGLPIAIPGGLGGWDGLPTIGFMIKHRDLGDPTLNYASSIEHAWTRVED